MRKVVITQLWENELFENNNKIENYHKNHINFFHFPQKHNFPCLNFLYDLFGLFCALDIVLHSLF